MISKKISIVAILAAFCSGTTIPAKAQKVCVGFGPQAPRDIAGKEGTNKTAFTLAPPAERLNLCNLHTHTNAEHKGPGFSIFAGSGEFGGHKCNESDSLTSSELQDPTDGKGAYKGVKPGDTIEVHWVYTNCDVKPGETLGACLSDACTNPQLRVEAQVFLLVNDPNALNFEDFGYDGNVVGGLHQPKALPSGTGSPVTYFGSTTGSSYTEQKCSPLTGTWSVRPQCAKLDISSLHRWAEKGNIFKETKSHGVRQIVRSKQLLAPID